MICHLCDEPAVGQCTTCFKFYCRRHGDRVCSACDAAQQGITPADHPQIPVLRLETAAEPEPRAPSGASCFACRRDSRATCIRCGRRYCPRHGSEGTCTRCYGHFRIGAVVMTVVALVGAWFTLLGPAAKAGVSPFAGVAFLVVAAALVFAAVRPFPWNW